MTAESGSFSPSHLEQKGEGLSKSLKVVDVVESRDDFHVLEERHSEDGKDEHDKEN